DIGAFEVVATAFSGLSSPTITYGTASTLLSGHLSAGPRIPTGDVAITLNGVTQTAPLDSSGNFSSTFDTGALGVAGSPYTVTYSYTGTGAFTNASDSSTTLTVTQATPRVTWADPAAIVYGTALGATQLDATASAVVNGSTVSVAGTF